MVFFIITRVDTFTPMTISIASYALVPYDLIGAVIAVFIHLSMRNELVDACQTQTGIIIGLAAHEQELKIEVPLFGLVEPGDSSLA